MKFSKTTKVMSGIIVIFLFSLFLFMKTSTEKNRHRVETKQNTEKFSKESKSDADSMFKDLEIDSLNK